MRTVITARLFKKEFSVPLADITHFTATDKYVTAHYPGGELILSESLNSLEAEFSSCTIRVHRGALVKTALVKWMSRDEQNNGADLKLSGVDQLIRVSRRNIPKVKQVIASLDPLLKEPVA